VWTAASVFVCALSLLGRRPQTFPPTELVETAPPGVSPLAAAYISREGGDARIVLITSTWAFMNARRSQSQCSDVDAIREIAGVLAHEEWHIRHGDNEEGAYDAQLTALLLVGTPLDGALFHKVKRSKDAVLAAARRASQATVVAHGTTGP
jgi:hypothetical protein